MFGRPAGGFFASEVDDDGRRRGGRGDRYATVTLLAIRTGQQMSGGLQAGTSCWASFLSGSAGRILPRGIGVQIGISSRSGLPLGSCLAGLERQFIYVLTVSPAASVRLVRDSSRSLSHHLLVGSSRMITDRVRAAGGTDGPN